MNICNHFDTDYRAAGYWLRINPELHRESLFRSGSKDLKRKNKANSKMTALVVLGLEVGAPLPYPKRS